MVVIDAAKVGLSGERLANVSTVLKKHVGDGKLAGAQTLVWRRGEVVHSECAGVLDRETDSPMPEDAIFRLYSMTKPITCVALMMLYERGLLQLFDPVSKFIAAFADVKVHGSESGVAEIDLEREITVHDLLTHTSGLTYHTFEYGPVEAMYREARVCSTQPLADLVADLARLPLAFQPGTAFRYSFAHDVVAHLVEILSDQPFDHFLRENLFEPLGMLDTGFYVPEDKLDRFTAMYGSGDWNEPEMTITRWYDGTDNTIARPRDCLESSPHNVLRGGVGLVSTAADYLRFCQTMLNGGELEGTRVLGRKTVELMTVNHLPVELQPFELAGIYSPGFGYGLGFSVLMDVGLSQKLGSRGEFAWLGAASTSFWVDPAEQLIGIQLAQFQPEEYHPLAADFRVATYQSIID